MQLEWVAPQECPDESAVTAEVKSLARERALAHDDLRVHARVVKVAAQKWRLELRVGEADEPRVVESDDCRKLASATALIVSLDLQALARRQDEERTAASKAQTEPGESVVAEPPAAPPRRAAVVAERASTTSLPRASSASSPTSRVTFGSRVVGDVGSLPTADVGVAIAGSFVHGPWRAELSATVWGRSRATMEVPHAVGTTVYRRNVAVRGCWMTVEVPIELDVCAGIELGSLRGVGFGVRRPSTSTATWFAGLMGLTARYPLGPRMSLGVSAEVGAPFNTPEAVIEGIGRVYEPSALFGRLALGFDTTLF